MRDARPDGFRTDQGGSIPPPRTRSPRLIPHTGEGFNLLCCSPSTPPPSVLSRGEGCSRTVLGRTFHRVMNRPAGSSNLKRKKGAVMRLYRAICAWLEASAAAMSEPEEFGPEGAGSSQAEHAHSFSAPPELHAASDRQSIDDDQGGIYRTRPIGFQRKG